MASCDKQKHGDASNHGNVTFSDVDLGDPGCGFDNRAFDTYQEGNKSSIPLAKGNWALT